MNDHNDMLTPTEQLLTEIRDLLEVLVAGSESQRYCLPLTDPDGEEVCPGGVALGPSFFEGKRRVDKWQHPLPPQFHKQMPQPKSQGTYLRTHHGPFTSQTTLVPPGVNTETGEIQEANPDTAQGRITEGESSPAERVFTDAARAAKFLERRKEWITAAASHHGVTVNEILAKLNIDPLKFAGIWNEEQLSRAEVKLTIAFQPAGDEEGVE